MHICRINSLYNIYFLEDFLTENLGSRRTEQMLGRTPIGRLLTLLTFFYMPCFPVAILIQIIWQQLTNILIITILLLSDNNRILSCIFALLLYYIKNYFTFLKIYNISYGLGSSNGKNKNLKNKILTFCKLFFLLLHIKKVFST